MELTTATLADFAQVRDGLLFVASGGITRLFRAQLPAPMGVSLALVIELDPVEAATPHEMRVIISDRNENSIAEIVGGFQTGNPLLEPGENLQVPVAFSLSRVGVAEYGRHEIKIYVDSHLMGSLRFWVAMPPNAPVDLTLTPAD